MGRLAWRYIGNRFFRVCGGNSVFPLPAAIGLGWVWFLFVSIATTTDPAHCTTKYHHELSLSAHYPNGVTGVILVQAWALGTTIKFTLLWCCLVASVEGFSEKAKAGVIIESFAPHS